MFHNLMMGFVVTLQLLACGFDKIYQMSILSCLYPNMRNYEFYKCRRCGFHLSTQVQMLGASQLLFFCFFQFCEVRVWQNWLKKRKFSEKCRFVQNLLGNYFLGYKNLEKNKQKKKLHRMKMNKESVKVIIWWLYFFM
jgi:hypothetical protein